MCGRERTATGNETRFADDHKLFYPTRLHCITHYGIEGIPLIPTGTELKQPDHPVFTARLLAGSLQSALSPFRPDSHCQLKWNKHRIYQNIADKYYNIYFVYLIIYLPRSNYGLEATRVGGMGFRQRPKKRGGRQISKQTFGAGAPTKIVDR